MRLIIILCILLIAGHVFTEASTLLEYFFPAEADQKVNPWLDSSFVFYGDKDGIPLKWFIKYLTDDLLWIIAFFCFALVAYQYSFRMFRVACVFFVYHIFDTVMLFVNFKTSKWLHWTLIVAVIVSVALMFIPEKQKAKVVSLK